VNGVHRIESGSAYLNAVVDGPREAPWLTCLHALATDLTLWDVLLPAWTQTYRVLRIDLRGHGGSTIGSVPYTIAGLAQDILAVWDALGVARSIVLGSSIGGMIGITLALDEPQRVSALIAADCRADAPAAFQEMFTAREMALAQHGMEGVGALTLPSWVTAATRAAQPELASALAATIRRMDPEAYLATTAALRSLALAPRLPELAVPALFVVGALDKPHPDAMRAMADVTPNSRFVEIPGAAHLAHLDQPEPFAAAVNEFLEGVQ